MELVDRLLQVLELVTELVGRLLQGLVFLAFLLEFGFLFPLPGYQVLLADSRQVTAELQIPKNFCRHLAQERLKVMMLVAGCLL